MAHRYATKDDLFFLSDRFNEVMSGHVRTFIVVQAATVVGMLGILFGLLRSSETLGPPSTLSGDVREAEDI